jgi:phosphoglycerate dehydrogenase-like enzyme
MAQPHRRGGRRAAGAAGCGLHHLRDPLKKIAILDDYERQAFALADWSAVKRQCQVDAFHRPLRVPDEAAEFLLPYDAVCLVRERTPIPASLIERLPNLRFIAATGPWNRTIDLAAARAHGIAVSHTAPREAGAHATAELAWGLALAVARHITGCDREMRQGRWSSRMGLGLHGQRLGLLGLGRIGSHMATIGRAFGMEVVAWSANLTKERAAAAGVQWVIREELLRTSDLVSLHVILSERTRGLIGREELSWMKPTSILVNTARGPLVDEAALVDALLHHRIAGAGLDVFGEEPLPAGHPLAGLDNVVLTPHLGFSTTAIFRGYFQDTVENLLAWLAGSPIRPLQPA